MTSSLDEIVSTILVNFSDMIIVAKLRMKPSDSTQIKANSMKFVQKDAMIGHVKGHAGVQQVNGI